MQIIDRFLSFLQNLSPDPISTGEQESKAQLKNPVLAIKASPIITREDTTSDENMFQFTFELLYNADTIIDQRKAAWLFS